MSFKEDHEHLYVELFSTYSTGNKKIKNKTAPMLQPLGETKGVFEDSSASFDEMSIHDLHWLKVIHRYSINQF